MHLLGLHMSEDWSNWYCLQISKIKKWATYRDRFLCPCCYMPTLSERAGYEICPICFWEDDGQDSDDADIIRGGPNKDYSLTEARSNFQKHHTMYRPTDRKKIESDMKKLLLQKKMYQAFSIAIQSGSEHDWRIALAAEAEYHNCS